MSENKFILQFNESLNLKMIRDKFKPYTFEVFYELKCCEKVIYSFLALSRLVSPHQVGNNRPKGRLMLRFTGLTIGNDEDITSCAHYDASRFFKLLDFTQLHPCTEK